MDLRPKAMEAAIDGVNEWVQPHINDGVYRCGFAVKQEAYEKAFACVAHDALRLVQASRGVCSLHLSTAQRLTRTQVWTNRVQSKGNLVAALTSLCCQMLHNLCSFYELHGLQTHARS